MIVTSELETRKIEVGIYSVYDGKRRLGSVARMPDGKWVAYAGTGHAQSGDYKTRFEAAEALRRR
jgi:hypothetical protein